MNKEQDKEQTKDDKPNSAEKTDKPAKQVTVLREFGLFAEEIEI